MSCTRALFAWLLPLAAATPWTPATAQPLDLHDLGAPAFASFASRDGLPNAVIVDVRTDRDGYVWAASPAGVFRYDGRHWFASDDPAMAHSVDALWVDHDGTLWAGFRSDGLARYDGGHWHVENRATGLPSQQVRRFFETTDPQDRSTLWALTWDQGLMVRRDGRWQADPDNASLPRTALLTMTQTVSLEGHRRQWVGTGTEGLWYRDEGSPGWKSWHPQELGSTQVEFVQAATCHGHEELWMSVFGVGLWRLDGDGLRRWSVADGGLPTTNLYDIAATHLPGGDCTIWVSSRSGLIRLHDDRVQVFDRRHGLPSDVVRGLNAWRSPNGNDVIWLATEGGVARTVLDANAWTTASLMGSRATGVFAVLVEPGTGGDERLWVGAIDDGLGLYEHGRWRSFTKADGSLPASGVRMIARAGSDGRQGHWIGLDDGELLREDEGLRGPAFQVVSTPWPKQSGEAVLRVLERQVDGHDELWVATRQSGLHLRRDGAWSDVQLPGVKGQWRATGLLEQVDASGRRWLWSTTDRGLARFDGARWDLLGRADGLPDVELIGLSRIDDAQGHPVLWLGSASAGIVRVNAADPAHPKVLPDDLPRAPDATAYGALRDSAGRVYVCTNNGVQQLVPAGGGYRSRVFARADGMVHDECNSNGQFIDAHDRYWAGTLGGLTAYDPHTEVRDTQAKPLRITGIVIDGREADVRPLRVHAGARDVRIDFALLSWNREDESRYRTRLIGYESTPDEWTAQASRSFNALPPGDYTLRVEARDYAGNQSRPVELSIAVEARWWQERWAALAGVLALLLLGYGTALLRTRQLRAQRRELEQRVAERTAELHTANARLMELSYSDALTGLANRRRLLERLDNLPEAGGSGKPTALVFVDVDHFKDFNDTWGHPAGDEALRAIAAALREGAPEGALVARYGGEEFACLLPGSDCATAARIAERFRATAAASDIAVPGTNAIRRVTISAGVACGIVRTLDDTRRLMRDADMALYQAKHDGRNLVRVWDAASGRAQPSDPAANLAS